MLMEAFYKRLAKFGKDSASITGHGHRNTLTPEVPGLGIEAAGDGGRAVRAAAFGAQVVAPDVVPVADDQCGVAARAEGGAAFAVVDAAGEDMVSGGEGGGL